MPVIEGLLASIPEVQPMQQSAASPADARLRRDSGRQRASGHSMLGQTTSIQEHQPQSPMPQEGQRDPRPAGLRHSIEDGPTQSPK